MWCPRYKISYLGDLVIKKSIQIDGRTIAYLDNEQGQLGTILFIHGNSFSSETFLAQFNSEILSEYRMLALDLYGHGDSDKLLNPFGYHLPNYAQLVIEFLKALRIENAVLAGHSLGGHIALEILSSDYKNFSGIFVWGTPPLSNPIKEVDAFLPNPSGKFLYQENLSLLEAQIFVSECFGRGEKNLKFYVDIVMKTVGNARVSLGVSVGQLKFSDEVKAIEKSSIDVGVIYSLDDKLVNPYHLKKISLSKLWKNQTHELAGSHFCHIDQSEDFNQLLLNYIQDQENSFFTNNNKVIVEKQVTRTNHLS